MELLKEEYYKLVLSLEDDEHYDWEEIDSAIIQSGIEVVGFEDNGDYCEVVINFDDKEEVEKIINDFAEEKKWKIKKI